MSSRSRAMGDRSCLGTAAQFGYEEFSAGRKSATSTKSTSIRQCAPRGSQWSATSSSVSGIGLASLKQVDSCALVQSLALSIPETPKASDLWAGPPTCKAVGASTLQFRQLLSHWIAEIDCPAEGLCHNQPEDVFVVQFPHPGREHNPSPILRFQTRMEWSEGDHRRKFMCSPGRYVDGDAPIEAKLTFWGEWEPPSDVVREWSPSGSLPRFLHAPVWTKSGPPKRQNTDPWVFGDHFRYSNCKQQAQPRLRRLTPGSVIFFGSTKDGEFVLDTVFVVKNSANIPRTIPRIQIAHSAIAQSRHCAVRLPLAPVIALHCIEGPHSKSR